MSINRKSFIKFLVLSFVVVSIAFAAPSQTYAAWWNPLSWFAKDKQPEEQKPLTEGEKNNDSNQTPQTDEVKTETMKEQREVAAIAVPQNNSTDAKIIEDLKTEIATLKATLDSLYKSHNNLVNDHNALLEYTKTIAATNKSAGVATIGSNLDTRVTDLEKKLNDVCAQIFSSIGGLSSNKCPSPQFLIKESLEYRIKKLEGGY